MRILPHFTFAGNAEEAMNFYIQVFGAKVKEIYRYGDMPEGTFAEMEPLTDGQKNLIISSSIDFGGNQLDFCDQEPQAQITKGDNIMMDICESDEKEIKRLFEALAEGGNILLPLTPQCWTPNFGIVTDCYGICWNIMQL